MTTKASEVQAELKETIARLEVKRDEYEQRLNIGQAKIEEGQALGQDTEAWQNHWISLLRQYEAVIDKLRDCRNQDVLL